MESQENLSLEGIFSPSQRIEILKDLCQNLDPFVPLNADMKSLLESLGIEHCDDPHILTKKLILMLEQALESAQKPVLQ